MEEGIGKETTNDIIERYIEIKSIVNRFLNGLTTEEEAINHIVTTVYPED